MFDYGHKLTAQQQERARQNVETARTMPRVVATADDDSFGKRIKKAADALPNSRKQHEERAAKERARYKPLQRRERTKGE